MKKILFATFLSLAFTSAFAEDKTPLCLSTYPSDSNQSPEVIQGFKQLLEKDFTGATMIFSEYLQKTLEQSSFDIDNDNVEAALTGLLIALAHQGAEKELFEIIGRFFVHFVINDEDDDFEEGDDDEDDWDSTADHLQFNYGIKKGQLLPLIESLQDSDLKKFILNIYLN